LDILLENWAFCGGGGYSILNGYETGGGIRNAFEWGAIVDALILNRRE